MRNKENNLKIQFKRSTFHITKLILKNELESDKKNNGFTKLNNLVIGFFFENAAIFSFPYQIYSSVQEPVIPAWMQVLSLTELLFCAHREKNLT